MIGESHNQISASGPTLTVLIPISVGPVRIRRLLRSLAAQADSRWEALVIGSPESCAQLATTTALRGRSRGRSRFIHTDLEDFSSIVNCGLAAARGDWVLIAPRDGLLDPSVTQVLTEHPNAQVVYSDERIEMGRKGWTVVRKPDFAPEWLRCRFYIGDPVFYRIGLLRALGGLREGFDGAELYDLALRATRLASQVDHIAIPLFQLPAGSDLPGAFDDGESRSAIRRTLQEHLSLTGGGIVVNVSKTGAHDTRRLISGEPLVSIVVPSRGATAILRGRERCMVLDAVTSVMEKSSYRNFEILVVLDDVAPEGLASELRAVAPDRVRVLNWDRPFNFSEKANYGAFHARGDLILFLNDDVEVISPTWLESLAALCQLPDAGMTGAMLYYDDNRIQHAGQLHHEGNPNHIGTGLPRGSDGPLSSYRAEREVSGVTAACAMVVREAFEAVGGFSLLLPLNFNDVDLSLKLAAAGYVTYWTPHAELFHYESMTRQAVVVGYEIETVRTRWGSKLDDHGRWPY